MKKQESINGSLISAIVDDRVFMNRFIILLSIIIALSVYIILGAANSVNNLSNNISYVRSNIVTLEDVERNINGNLVSLEITEDDFSEIDYVDLCMGLDKVESKEILKVESKPFKQGVIKIKPGAKKKKIFITSQISTKKVSYIGKSFSFMKKKFHSTNSSDISLKIAKKFYDGKNYKKALKWVLITNEIDSKNDDSWIIFANIKDKMGRTKDAIAALNHFIKSNNSTEAKKLLATLKAKV